MNQYDHWVPQELSKISKILWFEADDLTVFLMPVALFFILGINMPVSLAFAGVLTYYYIVEKNRHARGYIFHIGYIYGFAKFDGFESVKVKEYFE